MKVVLVHGISQSGKNTVTGILQSKLFQYDAPCIEVGNADAVKTVAECTFGWDKVKDEKGKRLLIDITNAGYNYDPFFWEIQSNKTIARVTHRVNADKYLVLVPDWRYPCTHEYWTNALGKDNVFTVHVIRPNHDNNYTDHIKKDSSETGLANFPFDYTVNNDGTLIDLTLSLNDLVDKLVEFYNA